MPATSLPELKVVLDAAPPVANTRLAIIVRWVFDRLDDAIDAVGVENIITEFQQLYDTYVAPVDVPWVPDRLEPVLVDAPIKRAIADGIRGFHNYIHGE